MRTSLTEIQEIENWLLQQAAPEDRLVMDARLQLSASLREQLHWQSQTYRLIHYAGREQLKAEIKTIESQLFTACEHKTFQDIIRSIFKL